MSLVRVFEGIFLFLKIEKLVVVLGTRMVCAEHSVLHSLPNTQSSRME